MIELESAAENESESEKRTVLSPRIVFMQLFHVDLCGRRRRRRENYCDAVVVAAAHDSAFFNIILHLKSVIL